MTYVYEVTIGNTGGVLDTGTVEANTEHEVQLRARMLACSMTADCYTLTPGDWLRVTDISPG